MLANPADRIGYLAILVSTQIVDLHIMPCGVRRALSNHMQNRVETILNIQVTFALLAVSQHLQMIRVFDQLFVEIDNVSVSVALAQN